MWYTLWNISHIDFNDNLPWRHCPLWGESCLITRTKANNAELWCFLYPYHEYSIEETVEFPLIWSGMTPTSLQWQDELSENLDFVWVRTLECMQYRVIFRGIMRESTLFIFINTLHTDPIHKETTNVLRICWYHAWWMSVAVDRGKSYVVHHSDVIPTCICVLTYHLQLHNKRMRHGSHKTERRHRLTVIHTQVRPMVYSKPSFKWMPFTT